ncbi:MAG: RNA polymerase sigma factor [Candidatus Marinimicrobia bacterium]|nr:RNA polymerase sigma factor [Candidatus Neomarinimicrobiota bacterium]
MDQTELVAAARSGDHNAFRELVRLLEPRVAATVIGMLGHCQEAEDVGQETFIRFYNALDKFRCEAKVETYVTRIAINLSLNELKRRQRKALLFVDQPEADLENLSNREIVEIDRDTQTTVRLAVRQLAPRFRAVIVLRLIDGYSTRETAEILNLPIGTVLSRLSRAQKKLKIILEPVFEGKV